MNVRRVAVTGMGLVTPLGIDVETSWRRLREGESGVVPITSFDVSSLSVKFGGIVGEDFDPAAHFPPKDVKRLQDNFLWFGADAARQALEDSGYEINENTSPRIGVIVGSGIGGIRNIEKNCIALDKGEAKISPFFIVSSIINMISGYLSQRYRLRGPNLSVVTACATSAHAIGLAARLIQAGDADAMLAGGAESPLSPIGIAGFDASRALSRRNEAPAQASRPWDRNRDGFVLGEGAGVLMLEEYESARRRGANIYAELIGLGLSGDAHHLTAPPDDAAGAAMAMRNALHDAQIRSLDVQYVNAHSTSTGLGDLAETRAIKSVFGADASKLAISSNKSMIGHLLGGSGGVEAVFTLLSLRDQVAPPTINLEEPDEECDLDYVPGTARDMKIDIALSNAFGFGGTNSSLLFRRL